MSTSPTSKPASPSSPEAGAELEPAAAEAKAAKAIDKSHDKTDDEPDDRERERKPKRTSRGTVEIELEVSRQRSIFWTGGGILAGILLILNLGTVGVWAGFALVGWGVVHSVLLARSFIFPPGTFVVGEGEVTLPRGPHRAKPVVVKPSAVTAVYLLRRSVPWNKAAPVLVVELGGRALVYPRDWFASEADQRHLVHALRRDREHEPAVVAAS